MGPSKLRKAIGAVKDQTSIGLAKVGSSASLSDLDVAIVKATRHEEYPPDERYVREILNLTTYSRTFVNACVRTIARRLSRTRNWVVALKTLMLIQRLLSEGDEAYEQEIFFATRRGTRLLNMCDFRDASAHSNSWDYSAFVRTYGLYLDEQLEFRMQGRRGIHGGYECHVPDTAIVPKNTPLCDMKIEKIFYRINHLMQLLERFLACKPTGAARENRVVNVALYPIVKESFQLCYDITEIMAILIERFMQLDIPEMVKVHEIFSRVSKQYDDVDAFYTWCKKVGIARSSEYPEVEKISQKRLDMMDDYIRERSTMDHDRRPASPDPEPELIQETEPEEDMNAIKALPPPETFVQEEEENEEVEEEPKEEQKKTQEEGNLLNLGENAPTTQEHGDKLALALFDGGLSTAGPENETTPWEAFKESSSGDWETALVQSASHLSNQKVSLPGGFDTLILDGMYQQGTLAQAVASSGLIATGSASSVALGSAGRPAMLALPAPPSAESGATTSENSDPFAASLAVPPPPYVQMSELEKKHNFLVQEQIMWQQYARDGMQGPAALHKANSGSYPYNKGGYTTTH
ncbi:putative clathrin assembly protein At1g03050 [Salvia miltiorrhiza]|uniref:putative clathrin assembly protein At1g03050 n=1 Tax=Salvia miltiorrhiza TaxID=226208 RepID=UPI0025AB9297|nr:putative clathrin assembly protein At1g03050 [Salvia miltiorrhiza]